MKKVLTAHQRAVLEAIRHGLSGQTMGVPHDELAAYELHSKGFFDECQPANPTEIYLVRTIANTSWWLKRMFVLENNLLNEGIAEHQARVPAGQPPLSHISAMTLAYCDQMNFLDKLGRHHERLSLQFHKSIRQLTKIQSHRRGVENSRLKPTVANRAQEDFDSGNCYRA